MREAKIKVFQFKELNAEAKKKALDYFRTAQVEHEDWHEFLIEQFEKELKAKGFEDPRILYSGFGSQGDGACFVCSKIDLEKWEGGKWAGKGLFINITHSARYFYATSTDPIITDDADALDVKQHEQISKDLTSAQAMGNDFYERLKDLWTGLQSNESVQSHIEANEYEFTEDGKFFTL